MKTRFLKRWQGFDITDKTHKHAIATTYCPKTGAFLLDQSKFLFMNIKTDIVMLVGNVPVCPTCYQGLH